jgi:hypothetical protein
MATQRDRDADKREQKRKDMDEAVERGSLVIRPMTDAERKRFPARERPPSRRGSTKR